MNDILFGNNNRAVISRLAKSIYSANRRRNLIAAIALALTACMITSVFSIGFSYFATNQMQQFRLIGTTADIAVTNPTEEQLEQFENSSFINSLGILHRLGSVETGAMKDALLGLVWLNDTEWQSHRLPTVSDLRGRYPAARNEIMLPTWALEQMGVTDPQLDMDLVLTYELETGKQDTTETFILSGYYTDYSAFRTNNRGAVYVSAAFRETAGLPLSSGGSAMIAFSNDDIERNCGELKNIIGLTEGQTLEIVPYSQASGAMVILVLSFIIMLIVLSGYLLIYNIFYISISKDTRSFGQLKTLGATGRQIKSIVRRQAFRTSLVGIPAGLLLGGFISFGVVPYALNMMFSADAKIGTELSFSPLIFIGAAAFTLFTAMVGSIKPARIAAGISPIAALSYTDIKSVKGTATRGVRSISPFWMAWENIFREKKSAALVFTSLFLGLFLFLVTAGLFSGLSPENFVRQWGEADFVLTYPIRVDGAPISENMLAELKKIEGIDHVRLTHSPAASVTADVEYDEEVFGGYVKSLEGMQGIDFSTPEKVSAYTQNFYSGIYGIDSAYVMERNQTAEHLIDLERFERGETILLSELSGSDGENLFQPGQKITVNIPDGQHTFTIAEGFLEADFQGGRGHTRGTAPDLFISQNAVRELFQKSKIIRVAFDTDGKQDEEILRQLKTLTAAQTEIDIISRYEKGLEIGGYIVTMKVLGMGISLVLLVIGVINFMNTMVVSVNTRRHEFAVLESIGMTKRQIKKVLLCEGFCYFAIPLILIAVFGTGLYTLLYFAFARMVPYAVLSYPIAPLLLIAGIVFIVCLSVPVAAYVSEIKSSITERLRTTE